MKIEKGDCPYCTSNEICEGAYPEGCFLENSDMEEVKKEGIKDDGDLIHWYTWALTAVNNRQYTSKEDWGKAYQKVYRQRNRIAEILTKPRGVEQQTMDIDWKIPKGKEIKLITFHFADGTCQSVNYSKAEPKECEDEGYISVPIKEYKIKVKISSIEKG